MLSPFILKPFTILIKKILPCFIKTDQFGRSAQHLLGTSAGNRNFI